MTLMKGIPAKLMLAAGLLSLAGPAAFAAPITSNTSTVALSATLPESLSINVTSGSSVTFALVAGSASLGNNPVNITTTWVLNNTRQNVRLTGWFANATAALTDGGSTPVTIPTSEVLGQVGSGSFTAFTQAQDAGGVGITGASLNLLTQAITSANYNSSATTALNLKIDLTSQPQLPAGTYTGTLNLQADAL